MTNLVPKVLSYSSLRSERYSRERDEGRENLGTKLGHDSQILFVSDCWIKMNASPVCLGARGDRLGTFDVPSNGKLVSVKLVHLHCSVTCDSSYNNTWSFWGCGQHNSKLVSVVITTSNDSPLLPSREYHTSRAGDWSFIPGYTSFSPELVLSAFSNPPLVTRGQELRLWYGEDFSNIQEGNNEGKACCDVYACLT